MDNKDIVWDDEVTWDEQPTQQTQTTQPNQTQSNLSKEPDNNNLLSALLLTAGGALGYSTYQGALVPTIQNNYQNNLKKQDALNTLKGLQKQLGIEGTEAELIPTRLSEIEKSTKEAFKLKENKVKYESELALKNSKIALENFDNKILNSKVEDLSKTLKESYPQFKTNASRGYEAGKVAIENYLIDRNIKFNSNDFGGVLDKTITRAINEGALPHEIQPLLQLKDFTASTAMTPQGAATKPLTFTQMKGYVSGITKNYSNSKISPLLNEQWLDFLNEKLPADVSPIVKGQLDKLTAGYKQFSNANRQYSKIVGTSGEFNSKAANKYLLDYFKSNIDDGTQNLISIISKGNDIVSGIEGVENKFNALTELKPQRAELTKQISVTQQLKSEALNKLSEDATQTITRIRNMRSKYNEFISRLKVQQEKELGSKLSQIPRIIKTLGKMGQVGRTILRALPNVTMISDAMKYAQDPEAYLYQAETGEELSPKGSEAREIQTGRII